MSQTTIESLSHCSGCTIFRESGDPGSECNSALSRLLLAFLVKSRKGLEFHRREFRKTLLGTVEEVSRKTCLGVFIQTLSRFMFDLLKPEFPESLSYILGVPADLRASTSWPSLEFPKD